MDRESSGLPLKLSTFRCDITPPLGHPLCGGWIEPAREIVDPLWANGIVLQSRRAEPLALVTLDWTGIGNQGYDFWRDAIARSIGTSPQRVALHCVHQHDAPWAKPCVERLLREAGAPQSSLDLDYFERAARAVARAARLSLGGSETVTDMGTGEAQVHEVASNRRLLNAEGQVEAMRYSACREERLRAAPEGLIDPYLKTISFWRDEKLLAALHFYATHPMSHYGQGGVSSDFCGLARDRLAQETGAPQLYFTGAAGNIGAGKYNDGSPPMRAVLTERMLTAMRASLGNSIKAAPEFYEWTTLPVRLPACRDLDEARLRAVLADSNASHSERCHAADCLSWIKRARCGSAIDCGCLALNRTRALFLPGEPFVEYQLYAQQLDPDRFTAFAGYGDCGPGYLPTNAAYAQGGYECGNWCRVEPAEDVLCGAIERLLRR
jgi:hypothetical protein